MVHNRTGCYSHWDYSPILLGKKSSVCWEDAQHWWYNTTILLSPICLTTAPSQIETFMQHKVWWYESHLFAWGTQKVLQTAKLFLGWTFIQRTSFFHRSQLIHRLIVQNWLGGSQTYKIVWVSQKVTFSNILNFAHQKGKSWRSKVDSSSTIFLEKQAFWQSR